MSTTQVLVSLFKPIFLACISLGGGGGGGDLGCQHITTFCCWKSQFFKICALSFLQHIDVYQNVLLQFCYTVIRLSDFFFGGGRFPSKFMTQLANHTALLGHMTLTKLLIFYFFIL